MYNLELVNEKREEQIISAVNDITDKLEPRKTGGQDFQARSIIEEGKYVQKEMINTLASVKTNPKYLPIHPQKTPKTRAEGIFLKK